MYEGEKTQRGDYFSSPFFAMLAGNDAVWTASLARPLLPSYRDGRRGRRDDGGRSDRSFGVIGEGRACAHCRRMES